ncbi:hypothetical protein J7S33_28330, partial [Saccharothrix algeriensis]
AAPAGYRAEFIGRTTRERRRLRLVADLEAELARAAAVVGAAEEEVSEREADVLAATVERDAFPEPTALLNARREAERLRAEADEARHRAAERTTEAERERDRVLALLDAAATKRVSRVRQCRAAVPSCRGDRRPGTFQIRRGGTGSGGTPSGSSRDGHSTERGDRSTAGGGCRTRVVPRFGRRPACAHR